MKTRMDKGMSRDEYKIWMARNAAASARNQLALAEANLAACIRRGRDTAKAEKEVAKARKAVEG